MSSHRLVIKDAARQLIGRIISAIFWFLTIKIMTPYLGPLQYGDYSTILKYFAIWTALADLWLYVLAVKKMGEIKDKEKDPNNTALKEIYGKFVGTRVIIMSVVYVVAIVIAYLLPAYTSNPYLIRGLPFGMIFSASFMFAGIQQLPLQIFRKMERLSITLITARLSQLAILIPVVYFIFKDMKFDGSTISILAFVSIIFSVVASAIGQNIEIHYRTKKLLPLKIKFDRKFTKEIIIRNWQYGVSYYLSSFHTLIVLLFLWRFFPTASGHDYAGIWALSLSLIEILLIIPSSLWNSLLHKIANYSLEQKRKSLWNFLTLMLWIGAIIAVNFWVFADWIIKVVASKAFIWSFDSIASRGSNQILPFLWIVLRRSFIKQVYNYLFVAVEKQNVLLPINAFGVILGIPLGIRMIPQYGLMWWVVTQLTIEFLFMIGAIYIGKRNHVQPICSRKKTGILLSILAIMTTWIYIIKQIFSINMFWFFVLAIFANAAMIYASLKTIKRIARWLTFEETIGENI